MTHAEMNLFSLDVEKKKRKKDTCIYLLRQGNRVETEITNPYCQTYKQFTTLCTSTTAYFFKFCDRVNESERLLEAQKQNAKQVHATQELE